MTHFFKRLNRKAIGYETNDRPLGMSCKAKCRNRGKDKTGIWVRAEGAKKFWDKREVTPFKSAVCLVFIIDLL